MSETSRLRKAAAHRASLGWLALTITLLAVNVVGLVQAVIKGHP